MASKDTQVTGWTGWVVFAGVMMVLQGIFHAVAGLTALFNSEWLVVTESQLLVFDFTTWGWIHLIAGILVLVAGFQVMQGSAWARVVGVFVAVVSALGALASVELYPFWSIVLITVDVLIIYALTVHGDEMKALD